MRKIIDLDECVIEALNLFDKSKPLKIDVSEFKRPIIVGSGNALVTGRILFEDIDAVFSDEGRYNESLNKVRAIDGAVLISASGGKHAPGIAKEIKKRGLKLILLTNNKEAEAAKFADEVYVFPKNIEPYTYNTSTYLGMILGKTEEDARNILKFILELEKVKFDVKKYDSFFFVIPEKFELVKDMILTKFDELFGAIISARVFTPEQTKHAKTVIPYEKELFIGLGYENKNFGKNRINIKIPDNANYGFMIALSYYLIGKIQKQNKPYFKKNIDKYVVESSKVFRQKINSIVK